MSHNSAHYRFVIFSSVVSSCEKCLQSMVRRLRQISGQRQKLYLDRKAFYLAIDQPTPEGDN